MDKETRETIKALYKNALGATSTYHKALIEHVQSLPPAQELPTTAVKNPPELKESWNDFKEHYKRVVRWELELKYEEQELAPSECLIDSPGILRKVSDIEASLEKAIKTLDKETGEQGEGKGKEKEEVKARLRLVSGTQDIYWDDQEKKEVTENEFYALWLLAHQAQAKGPTNIVEIETLEGCLLDAGESEYSGINVSRLIRGRKDRSVGLKYHFPETVQLIKVKRGVGYYLDLSPDEIELVGDHPQEIKRLIENL